MLNDGGTITAGGLVVEAGGATIATGGLRVVDGGADINIQDDVAEVINVYANSAAFTGTLLDFNTGMQFQGPPLFACFDVNAPMAIVDACIHQVVKSVC